MQNSRISPASQRVLDRYRQEHSHYEHPQIPQQLDFVIDELLHPKESTTPSKVLGYLAYYYPTIKNERNVELLTYNFLQSPLFFDERQSITMDMYNQVFEFFSYIIVHKFKISLPHLSFHKFYQAFINAVQSFCRTNADFHWKVIPVIGGALSTSKTRQVPHLDHKLTPFFHKALAVTLNHSATDVRNGALIVASYNIDLIQRQLGNFSVPVANLIYKNKLGHISTLGSVDWRNDAVLKNLGNLAKLVEFFCYSSLQSDIKSTMDILSILVDRVCEVTVLLSKTTTPIDPELLKNVVFANIMILESVVNASAGSQLDPQFQLLIADCSLKALFFSNFIVEDIGVGGFNSYHYIYYYCVEVLLKGQAAERFVVSMQQNINFDGLRGNSKESAKLKFYLNCTDDLYDGLSFAFKTELKHRLTELIRTPNNQFFAMHDPSFRSVLESAHSTILKYIEKKELKPGELHWYLDVLFEQYPHFLSLDQITIALRQVAVSEQLSFISLFTRINHKIIQTPPGVEIRDGKFETLRASWVMLLCELLIFCNLEEYHTFLQTTFNLVNQIGNKQDHDILYRSLFDSIMVQNKSDPRKGSLGVTFWYQNVEPTMHARF